MPIKLVLLDRDGTLIIGPPAGQRYTLEPATVQLEPTAGEAVALLNRAGVSVAVVTNQRAVALGLLSPEELNRIHARIEGLLAARGARIDAWFVCPHDIGECNCRKPASGMVQDALSRFGIVAGEACIVGDSESDVVAGQALGLLAFRITEGQTAGRRAQTVLQAVQIAMETQLPADSASGTARGTR